MHKCRQQDWRRIAKPCVHIWGCVRLVAHACLLQVHLGDLCGAPHDAEPRVQVIPIRCLQRGLRCCDGAARDS